MSSYLYDVSDGQIRLDTVLIYDAKEQWTEADMRICADNTLRPYCDKEVAGILQSSADGWQLYMPRLWWSSRPSETRNHTDTENPLNLVANSTDYRSKTHEFGHYALGFYDEYLFWDAASDDYVQDNNLRCLPASYFRYGFMDWQYESGGVMSSEMSNNFRYEIATCRNTNQWGVLTKSCWDHLESWVEAVPWGPDHMFVPILKPDVVDTLERVVTNPGVYFPGPNNDVSNPDYNVGNMVHFPHPVGAQAVGYSNKHVTVHHSTGGDNAEVTLWNNHSAGQPTEQVIKQGNTSDAAGIWVLGVCDAANQILAYKGASQGTVTPSPAVASTRQVTSSWLYGMAESSGSGVSMVGNRFTTNITEDSISIELAGVSGSYPLIFAATLSDNVLNYSLTSARPFSSDPSVQLLPSYGINNIYPTTATSNGYETSVSDSFGTDGLLMLWAIDDSAATYFVPTKYVSTDINRAGSLIWLYGRGAQSEFKLDSANTAIEKAFILSSPYPVIRTGLDENAVQAGQTHCLSVYPDNPLAGSNQVVIRYDDADLKLEDQYLGDEATLAAYHWVDATTGWILIGGTIDTVQNTIYAPIAQTGIYAAFTNQIITGVEDDEYGDILPYQFELSQNYPNPFNPVTTIEYSLPERSSVTIEVFNVVGQKVRTLVDRVESAGSYTVTWDGTSSSGQPVSTGVYLYRFQAGDHVESKKMLLLK